MPDIKSFFKKIILLNLMGRCLKDGDRKKTSRTILDLLALSDYENSKVVLLNVYLRRKKRKFVLSGIIIFFSLSYFPCKVILATKIIIIVKALKYPYYIKFLVKKCFLNKNKKKLLPANSHTSF